MPFNYGEENKKLSHPPRFSPLPGSFLEVNTPKRERDGNDSNTNTPSFRKKGLGASPKPGASPLKSSADVPSEQKKKRRKTKAANGEQAAGEAVPKQEGAEGATGEKKRKRRPRKKKNAEGGEGQPKTPAKEQNNKSAANTPAGQKGKRSSPVYDEYWTEEQVEQAVKEGKAHLAELRVNPYNRSEG